MESDKHNTVYVKTLAGDLYEIDYDPLNGIKEIQDTIYKINPRYPPNRQQLVRLSTEEKINEKTPLKNGEMIGLLFDDTIHVRINVDYPSLRNKAKYDICLYHFICSKHQIHLQDNCTFTIMYDKHLKAYAHGTEFIIKWNRIDPLPAIYPRSESGSVMYYYTIKEVIENYAPRVFSEALLPNAMHQIERAWNKYKTEKNVNV